MKKHLCTKVSYTKICLALLMLLSFSSLAFADNPSEAEELQLLKQDYRTFLISQRQAANFVSTEAEEMRLVKQDYLAFLMGQRQAANTAPTEAEEMKLVKQHYRAFLLEQHQTQQLARNE